jgi:hypothetical protein
VEYVLFFLLLCISTALVTGLPNMLVGLRDLTASLKILGRRPTAISRARRGPVLLRGRVARRRLLVSPDGTRYCVAWSSRRGWTSRASDGAESFELVDATGTARIDAEHPLILGPDEDGYEGESTRLVADGEEVIVYGDCTYEVDPQGQSPSFREPPRALVLKGRRVVIAPVGKWSGRNLLRGTYRLAWGAFCVAIAVAMWV